MDDPRWVEPRCEAIVRDSADMLVRGPIYRCAFRAGHKGLHFSPRVEGDISFEPVDPELTPGEISMHWGSPNQLRWEVAQAGPACVHLPAGPLTPGHLHAVAAHLDACTGDTDDEPGIHAAAARELRSWARYLDQQR
jgi:hypothetical protein